MTLGEFEAELKALLKRAMEAGLDPDEVGEIAEAVLASGEW